MTDQIAPDEVARTPQPRRVSRADHRQQTRAALLQSARRLFDEHGYHGVSADEIARGAGVTERTLFRYFPSKVSLVLDPLITVVPELLTAIANRPLEEPPYVAIREALVELRLDYPPLQLSDLGPNWREIDLPADERERWLSEFVAPLAETLRLRYAVDPLDLRAEVWARSAVAALTTALAHFPVLAQTSAPMGLAPLIGAAFEALNGRV